MATLARAPETVNIVSVWGEPLSITVECTDEGTDDPTTGITACTAVITDTHGVTTLAEATTVEVSTGVWSANWSAAQMTDDVEPGLLAYAVTITIDGSEQTIAAGDLRLKRPARSGV